MRIVRFRDPGGHARHGIVDGRTVYAAHGDSLTSLEAGNPVGPLHEVSLLAPVRPGKIVCVGLNYADHVTERESWREIPTEPALFLKPPSAVIGPDADIVIAHPEHPTHYEAELAVVIGRSGRNVRADGALEHVLGYTCANDITDDVLHETFGQGMRCKSYDTYCPLGPWIETDFDPGSAWIESRQNGDVRQSSSTSSMIFDVPFLIQFISAIMTLEPDDVILTGTPANIAPLREGDLIEVEISGIGVLPNTVRMREVATLS